MTTLRNDLLTMLAALERRAEHASAARWVVTVGGLSVDRSAKAQPATSPAVMSEGAARDLAPRVRNGNGERGQAVTEATFLQRAIDSTREVLRLLDAGAD